MAIYFVSLIIAAFLGLIPANIAKKKGHSFGLWWFYGWMLFIVAIIHVQFIEDYNAPKINAASAAGLAPGVSAADEIKKYRDLADQGAISEDEFQEKKNQLLGAPGSSSSAASVAAEPVEIPFYAPDTVPATADPGAARVRKAQPVIYVNGGQYRNRKYRMGSGTVLVGRRPDCQIRYEDGTPGISGEHCTVTWDAVREEFIVRDLASTYGTFRKDGTRLKANQSCRLETGELLQLGDFSNYLRLTVE